MSQFIEMKDSTLVPDTARQIRNELLPSGQREQGDRIKEQIFNPDSFWVAKMDDPARYLPANILRAGQSESCVETISHCCGWCLIGLSHMFACCCCKCYLYELGTSRVGLVQKFGKFNRLLRPGFNFVNPCSQEVSEVDLRIRVLHAGRTESLTKDNVEVKIDSSVAFRIINPIVTHYQVGASLDRAVTQLVTSSFRNTIGVHNLQDVLTDRFKIIDEVKQYVISNMPVGVSIENIFLEDITMPANIARDLSSAARERRLAEATIINSQGDVESASLMKETSQLLDTKAAMQIRYLELVELLGRRGATVLMEIGVNKKGFKEDK